MWLHHRLRVCVSFVVLALTFIVGYLIGRQQSNTIDADKSLLKVDLAGTHRHSGVSASPNRNVKGATKSPHPPRRNSVDATNSTGKHRQRESHFEFVVSHYNEGLDWLRPIAAHSHVYHKGSAIGPAFDVLTWEALPNVGREAHTYLHHIINKYNDLPDVTVFLQGHGPGVDAPYCFEDPMDFVRNAERNISCVSSGRLTNWDRIPHFGKWKRDLDSGAMRRANHTLGEFYAAVFGTAHPPSVAKCSVGCFSATRKNLRRHPTAFYQRAMSFLTDHDQPEEAHYMERLWKCIVSD